MTAEQYYALCVGEEDGSTEIAFFELEEKLYLGRWVSPYTLPPMATCSAGTCKATTTCS